jgi:hypothetical protein
MRARKLAQVHKFHYKEGETWEERHERRLQFALRKKNMKRVRDWCHEHQVRLDITESGRNWCFRSGWLIAMWEPYSATFMATGGVTSHVHDWSRLQPLLETFFNVCTD